MPEWLWPLLVYPVCWLWWGSQNRAREHAFRLAQEWARDSGASVEAVQR